MSSGIYSRLDAFNERLDTVNALTIQGNLPIKEKPAKIENIKLQAMASIENWKEKPYTTFDRFKYRVKNLFITFSNFTRLPERVTSLASDFADGIEVPDGKTSADEPYEFPPTVAGSELESRALLMVSVAKVVFIVSSIFLVVGVVGPIILLPLLFTMAESTAFGIIAASTILGVVGVVGIVIDAHLLSSESVNEYKAKTDKDFQRFTNEFIEGGVDEFNLQQADIQEGEIYSIYETWKSSTEKVLDDVH